MLATAALCAAAATPVTVAVPGLGSAVGVSEDGVDTFRGLPYAAPPVGDLRWRPPQPAPSWGASPLNATDFKHDCVQSLGFKPRPGVVSEDCLYLNVYAPTNRSGGPKPVVLWIHGGGFSGGGGNESRLDGRWMLRASGGDVLSVTINYRLNAFGFLGGDLFRTRDPEGSTGNYGILDQRAAMRWVQRHISAFGGDPTRVLLVGESAGAMSVSNHLVREKSFGLFSRAGMESGAFVTTSPSMSIEHANWAFAVLVNHSACNTSADVVSCLVSLSAEEVFDAYSACNVEIQIAPIVDGVDLLDTPWALGAKGKVAPGVPVFAGSVREDLGHQHAGADATRERFEEVYQPFVDNTTLLADLYSTENATVNYTKWYWADAHAGSDRLMACPARRSMGWFETSYRYWFTHVPEGPSGVYPRLCHHACEIPFVFDVHVPMYGEDDMHVFPSEYALSDAMVTYWTNFAVSGDPNKPKTPTVLWPKWSPNTDLTLELGDEIRVVHEARKRYCDFWDQHQIA